MTRQAFVAAWPTGNLEAAAVITLTNARSGRPPFEGPEDPP